MDLCEFRLKNIPVPPETEAVHKLCGNVHFQECLQKGREALNGKRKEACRKESREQRRHRYGVGMALASHTSSLSPRGSRIPPQPPDPGGRQPDPPCGHSRTTAADCYGGKWKNLRRRLWEIGLDNIELNEADTQNSLYDLWLLCQQDRIFWAVCQTVLWNTFWKWQRRQRQPLTQQEFSCYRSGNF